MACRAEIDDWIDEIKLLPGLHVFTLSTLLPRTQTQEFPPLCFLQLVCSLQVIHAGTSRSLITEALLEGCSDSRPQAIKDLAVFCCLLVLPWPFAWCLTLLFWSYIFFSTEDFMNNH